MHTASYMLVILRAIPAIHVLNALREVLGQRVGKFLLKTIIALYVIAMHWKQVIQCYAFLILNISSAP